MKFRLAEKKELFKIKEMYINLVDRMHKNGIEIWDNIYPCEFFEDDIANNRLYILLYENEIAGAFALCESSNGENQVEWESKEAKCIYVDKLGVNIKFSNQGVATHLLNCAAEIAVEKSAVFLRLFVVDTNVPAINLYEKNGFRRATGIYVEEIDDTLSFIEYGYEKRVLSIST